MLRCRPPRRANSAFSQTGDHPEDFRLRAILQLRLETDHVVERAERIVLTKLDDGIGLDRRIVGVGEPHRFHRSVAKRLASALRHHLDRQAAIEVRRAFPLLEAGLVAGHECVDEGVVLALRSSGS